MYQKTFKYGTIADRIIVYVYRNKRLSVAYNVLLLVTIG